MTVSLHAKKSKEELPALLNGMRGDIIRMVYYAKSGHIGGSLSAINAMTVLYQRIMNFSLENFEHPDRDRLVLSKGHASPAVYVSLAELGFLHRDEFPSFRQIGSPLQGHPEHPLLDGVEATTGSLGNGISQAVGMALAKQLDKSPARIYAILGDGESQEGIVWEAVMAAAHYKLSNFTVFYDKNRLQIDGFVEDVMDVGDVAAKFKAFGWHVIELADGHDLDALEDAFLAVQEIKDRPQVVLGHTIKGKGVSFMENNPAFHGAPPSEEQFLAAMKELNLGADWN